MKIDVNRLLELDYLNSLVSQLNNEINKIRKSFLGLYDLDILKGMDIKSVNDLFNQYGINNSSVVQFLESDYIDNDWEFADLFFDDISYSSELREQLKAKALEELK